MLSYAYLTTHISSTRGRRRDHVVGRSSRLRSAPVASPALMLATVALSACFGRPPARIVAGRSDTVVVNSRQPTLLPVRVLDADGRILSTRGVHFAWVSGDRIPVSEDGVATCDRRADVMVRASRGPAVTRFLLRCRPIGGFRTSWGMHLRVGGQAEPLPVAAIGLDGQSLPSFTGTVTVLDSQVVAVHDGFVFPKARGVTYLSIEAGDCSTSIRIEVKERTLATDDIQPSQDYLEHLRMVGGELRSWRVPVGRYIFSLASPIDRSTGDSLALAVFQANCARLRGEGQRYSCVARPGAAVVVRHSRGVGQGRELSGDLGIERLPDPRRSNLTLAAGQNGRKASRSVARPRPSPFARSCMTYIQ